MIGLRKIAESKTNTKNMIDEHCSNCMDAIVQEPIVVTVDKTIHYVEDNGCGDYDVEATIYFCSEECRKEYFIPVVVNNN